MTKSTKKQAAVAASAKLWADGASAKANKATAKKSAGTASAAPVRAAAPAMPPNYRCQYTGSAVPRVQAVEADSLTPDEFMQQFVLPRVPVVLRPSAAAGGADANDEFAALRRNWRSVALLRQQAGEAQVRVEWKEEVATKGSKAAATSATSFGRGQHDWMNFGTFLDHLQGTVPEDSTNSHANHSLYLTSQPIASDAEGAPVELCAEPITSLLGDLPLRPRLLGALTPVQYNCWVGGYRGAASAPASAAASSFGPAPSPFHRSVGSTSGLHHDFHDNIYVLLAGHKFFHLYPPSDAPYLYAHGMLAKEDAEEDDEATAEPAMHIHANGVIEYVDAAELHTDAPHRQQSAQQRAASKAKAKKLAQQMEEEDEEDEDMEDQEKGAEDDGAAESADEDATLVESMLDDSDASFRAIFASKCLALTEQLSELDAALVKVSLALKFETSEKRVKHLTTEKQGLQKKTVALKLRLEKAKQEEATRIEQAEAAKLAAADEDENEEDEAAEDDEDDDDTFPSEADLANMVDDYEGSDDDQAVPMDDSDDQEEDDEDEDDEDDEEIDPAEKAAWKKFMDAANAKTKGGNGKGKTSAPAAASGKKRGKDQEDDDEEERPTKKQKAASTSATAAATQTSSTSSSSTPSSSESFPSNFSRLDFSRLSRGEIEQQYPLYAKHCKPLVVELKQGEMLYLPASWFHEVFSCSAPVAAKAAKPAPTQPAADALAPSVHFALNYWYQPPSNKRTLAKPYSAEDRDCETRWGEYYRPRVEKLQVMARTKANAKVAAAQAATKPKADKPQASKKTAAASHAPSTAASKKQPAVPAAAAAASSNKKKPQQKAGKK